MTGMCAHDGCNKHTVASIFCPKHSCRGCNQLYLRSDGKEHCDTCRGEYSPTFVQQVSAFHGFKGKNLKIVQDRSVFKLLVDLYRKGVRTEEKKGSISTFQQEATHLPRRLMEVTHINKESSGSEGDTDTDSEGCCRL